MFSLFANKEYGGQVLVLSDSPAAALSAHEFSVGETIEGDLQGKLNRYPDMPSGTSCKGLMHGLSWARAKGLDRIPSSILALAAVLAAD